MADPNQIRWTWSEPYQDWYYVTQDASGQSEYHFQRQVYATAAPEAQSRDRRIDSGTWPGSPVYPSIGAHVAPASGQALMPEPIDPYTRRTLPNFIEGTPRKGWYETLDNSYRMRTGAEAHEFFRKGRVFSMLYSEATSETLARRGPNGTVDNDCVTVVKFGETVFSQIRRFVIVAVKRNFVYACSISTYNNRGVLKPGCYPAEHAIVYFTGSNPTCLHGEYERGMTKDAIEIEPADTSLQMLPASRIRFGKTYSIEWNVKVKDIGRVQSQHLSRLISYWRSYMVGDDDAT